MVVEQVSHHPPITAYYISNDSRKLSLQGHNAQKTSFSGASIIGDFPPRHLGGLNLLICRNLHVSVKQIGHAVLTIVLPSGEEERYLITFPRLVIAGLLVGSPYIELSEQTYIASSTGWLSTVCHLILIYWVFIQLDYLDRVLWSRLFLR